jgi:RNA-directed DNA polymerase
VDAGRDLTFDRQYGRDGSGVEADIKGFFDHVEHTGLGDRRRVRLDDRAFLTLIRKWRKAGILDRDGQGIPPETGTPQGGTVSPVLAKGYVHDARDGGGAQIVTTPGRGEARRWRSAEDWVCACREEKDAERLYRVLPKR